MSTDSPTNAQAARNAKRARVIGKPVDRVDARLKVTGRATYAAEFDVPALTFGVLVGSPIAAGRIKSLNASDTERSPGVLTVITHKNRGKLHSVTGSMLNGMPESSRLPLADDKIHFVGQYIALVVAETLEKAQHAASLIHFEFEQTEHVIEPADSQDEYKPKAFNFEPLQLHRGHVERELTAARVRLDETYETPREHPSPMEPHAVIASWSGKELTVRNATQWCLGDNGLLSKTFKIPNKNVHVIAPYLGGMFGSKGITGAHVVLAALAARELKRPVKIVITRKQVLTNVGHRPSTEQRYELGSDENGKIRALRHTTTTPTSILDEFAEPANITTRKLYDIEHYEGIHILKRVNTVLPSWMRAPGEAPCQFAQEVALDELAYRLDLDPIVLRRRNDARVNPDNGKPYSCKHLMECYERGAERVGWSHRSSAPGGTREGHLQIGFGTATATYPGYLMGATVAARLVRTGDGVRLELKTAASDVGTGLYTVTSMAAADALGLPLDAIDVRLGDSQYPVAPVAGGSTLTASVTPAAAKACNAIREQLIKAALKNAELAKAFSNLDPSGFEVADGRLSHREATSHSVSFAELMDSLGVQELSGEGSTSPIGGHDKHFTYQSFGAVFAEVAVDADLGRVRVRKLTGVYDAGRMMNAKTARSQILGGMVFGLGMALLEELVADPKSGRFINTDLGGYLVPVNADMPEFDISFIDEPDLNFNALGCRGIGELGNPGTAAAIANAVFNATGKRIRSLPITIEKLLTTHSVLDGEA